MEKNVCDICVKILHFEDRQILSLRVPIKDGSWLFLHKHRTCPPFKKCYYEKCKKNSFKTSHGEEPCDFSIGRSIDMELVLINYCSRSCQKRDNYYLSEIYEEVTNKQKLVIFKTYNITYTVYL